VSGTCIDIVFARQLQLGDPDGLLREALSHFPNPALAQRILRRYFKPEGMAPTDSFRNPLQLTLEPNRDSVELIVCANFCQIWLAKQGHNGLVGVNYLEKLQLPLLPSIYGALLANVDYILIGAGIPNQIPAVLEQLAQHQEASYRVFVSDSAQSDDFRTRFNPSDILHEPTLPLAVPYFLPIVSSSVLAQRLMKAGRIDGFVVEGPLAGGHNAPPRGTLQLTEKGEPLYGERDNVDCKKLKELGLPFWLAGTYASPEKMREALELGANGIQVGSIFALCEESGMTDELKRNVRSEAFRGEQLIFTDPLASPTGFPFKVAQVPDTISESEVYDCRERKCDIGRLTQLYVEKNGSVGSRCPSEPVNRYVAKGGSIEDTLDRKCLCNGLLAAIGLPQHRNNAYVEPPLVTLGNDLGFLRHLMTHEAATYTAEDAVRYLLS
jgi:NAD(P)H-dependent flavin oxidoreductase YrpB (nitropropane dioxygenase family)